MKSISLDSAYSKTETHIFWNSEKTLTEASQVKNPKRGVSKSKRTGREKVEKSRLEGFSGIPKTILRRSCESRKLLCQPSTVSGTFLQRVSLIVTIKERQYINERYYLPHPNQVLIRSKSTAKVKVSYLAQITPRSVERVNCSGAELGDRLNH